MTIKRQTLAYTAGGDELKGYLAFDDESEGARPGVMVIHEWWGLDDYIRTRTDKLAELGYTALAIDMYGNGANADSPDEAGGMMNAVLGNMEIGTSRLRAAHDVLCAQTVVDKTRTAAIGYCFGGAMVLHMARIGMPLKAVVSFHGSLGSFHTPTPREIQSRILICHGANDSSFQKVILKLSMRRWRLLKRASNSNPTRERYTGLLIQTLRNAGKTTAYPWLMNNTPMKRHGLR